MIAEENTPSSPEFHFPQTTSFSPNLEFWTQQEIVKPMVLTRDLMALHQWQTAHNLLPNQAPGDFVSVSPSSGIVEHRRITMPGHLVPKLAGVEGVFAVYDDSSGPEPVGALPGGPNSVKSGQIHGATDAWERGYNGSGVRVAVADSGIDFAHPDLNGTQAVLEDPGSPYDGWGIMHDPISLVRWQRDGLAYPSAGNSWWVETTNIDADSNNDSLLDVQGWDIGGIMPSKSGDYHFGLHSDSKLIQRAGGDVIILVVDTHKLPVFTTPFTSTSIETVNLVMKARSTNQIQPMEETPMTMASGIRVLDCFGGYPMESTVYPMGIYTPLEMVTRIGLRTPVT